MTRKVTAWHRQIAVGFRCADAVTQAVQWDQGVSDAWSRIAQIGPKILVFAFAVAVGAVVIRGVLHAADRMLEQAGLDGAIDRAGASRLLRCQTGVIRGWLLRLVAVIGLLAVLRAALGVFGPSPADRMAGAALALLARALLAAVIALLGLALAARARRLVTESFAGLQHGNLLSRVVAGFAVLAFGKAALDELGIGTSVTTPLLYAVLATGTGVVVVGVGGGLVRPMQSRWEDILDRAEDSAGEARAVWRANRVGTPNRGGTPPPPAATPATPAPAATSPPTPAATPAPTATPAPAPRRPPGAPTLPGAAPGALPKGPSTAEAPGRVPSTDPAPASPRTALPSPSVLPGPPPTSPVRGENQLPGTVSD